jgi:hypothetical protein
MSITSIFVNTVASISIENQGSGYQNGVYYTLNKTHGRTSFIKPSPPDYSNITCFYVTVTTGLGGKILTATLVSGKTGFNYSVNDLVQVNGGDNNGFLKVDTIQPV